MSKLSKSSKQNSRPDDFEHNYKDVFGFNGYKLFQKKDAPAGLERTFNESLITLYTVHKSAQKSIHEVNEITYVNDIFPMIKDMLLKVVDVDMLKTRVDKRCLVDDHPSIYVETVAYLIAFGNRITFDLIHPVTLCNVLSFYPNLLFNVLYQHTIEEQKEIMIEVEKNKYEVSHNVENLDTKINILKEYWNNRESYKHVFNYFNNLHGIMFTHVKQTYNDLPKGNLFIINIGHNYENSTYVYSKIQSIEEEFATEKNVSNFKMLENINIHNRSQRYTIVKNGPKTDDYFIILNYCNDKDDKKCLYSFNPSKTYTEREISVIIEGGIVHPQNTSTYAMYFSKTFENKMKFNYYSINYQLTGILATINKLYSPNYQICKNNWSKFFGRDPLLKKYFEQLGMSIVGDKLKKDEYISAMKRYYLIE